MENKLPLTTIATSADQSSSDTVALAESSSDIANSPNQPASDSVAIGELAPSATTLGGPSSRSATTSNRPASDESRIRPGSTKLGSRPNPVGTTILGGPRGKSTSGTTTVGSTTLGKPCASGTTISASKTTLGQFTSIKSAPDEMTKSGTTLSNQPISAATMLGKPTTGARTVLGADGTTLGRTTSSTNHRSALAATTLGKSIPSATSMGKPASVAAGPTDMAADVSTSGTKVSSKRTTAEEGVKAPSKKSGGPLKMEAIAALRQKRKEEQERLQREEERMELERKQREEELRKKEEETQRLKEEQAKQKAIEHKKAEEERSKRRKEQIKLEKMRILGIKKDGNAQIKFRARSKKDKTKPKENEDSSNVETTTTTTTTTSPQIHIGGGGGGDDLERGRSNIDGSNNEISSAISKINISNQESKVIGGDSSGRRTRVKENWEDVSMSSSLEEEEGDEKKGDEKEVAAMVTEEKGDGEIRYPICCVLGHVDTGKTKLLDKIRRTNVQDGEVGGITQQIGVTYVPILEIERMMECARDADLHEEIKVPGLLMVDTPGHASFSNLRNRGSSLCDISILVVDIMHGLEKMTMESLRLLRKNKVPFIVALNKVDCLHNWKSFVGHSISQALDGQSKTTQQEFERRLAEVIVQFAEQGLNANLFTRIKTLKELSRTISLVPTSAITGEGIPDLLFLMIQLVQKLMKDHLWVRHDEFQCTVLEVKLTEGLGYTLDSILTSGTICEGDKFMICGFDGPIISSVKVLLTPPPARELRVKSAYIRHKTLHASQGVKIVGPGLDRALAGSQLFLIKSDEQIEQLKDIVTKSLDEIKSRVKKVKTGVYVQVSTLGSLEALLDFLSEECHVPVFDFGLGPVHLKNVKSASVMLEHKPEYACILAFDVKVVDEARALAEKLKVKILEADIIYTLQDQFLKHLDQVTQAKQKKASSIAIFPCKLRIHPEHIIRTHDPIVLGVHVEAGVVKKGTPICVWSKTKECYINLGVVTDIQKSQKPVSEANTEEDVAICITPLHDQQKYSFSRHFDHQDALFSSITRHSLDALKEGFPEFCKRPEIFALLKSLKQQFEF